MITLLIATVASPAPGQVVRPEPADVRAEGYLPGADGARIHYRVLGSAPDTIVAVHGGPGAGMNAVLPELAPLAERRTVIFYDQRGGGLSTLPSDTSLLHARYHVADLEAVRDFFDLERMTVIAHSFGSILVARYAMEHPERLDRIVFFGAVGPRRAAAAALARSAAAPPDSALQARLRGVMGALMSGSTTDPVADCREYEAIGREMALARGESGTWKGTSCAMPPEAVRYYFRHTAQLSPRSFGDWDFTESLGDLEAPLLVIQGEADPEAVPPQRAWAEAAPNGRILLVPGAGKAVSADRPDLFYPAVEAFLDGAWPAGAEAVADTASPPAGAVEYLANEGVIVASGDRSVVIDGLFGDGLAAYPTVEPAVRDSLERAAGRFAGIDAVLVTHVHRDHFDARAVARHLAANPGARLIAPSQALDTLRAEADLPPGLLDRIHAVRLAPGESARFELDGIEVRAVGLVHPPSRNEPVELLGFRVALDGAEVAHLGDASPDPAALEPFRGVDLLLAPWWVVVGEAGARRVAAVGARRVAGFHLARETSASDVHARFADGVEAVVLDRPGRRMALAE